MEKIKIVIVDDHILLRSALASLINSFENIQVIFQANNGKDLVEKFSRHEKPDVLILDLNMPDMDGYETAKWLKDHHPEVHVLMLTMYDSELSMIKLLQSGVKGFLKKDIHPSELKFAIQSVMESGYYYSGNATGKLVNLFRKGQPGMRLENSLLTDQEIKFLRLACSDMTYKEIAQQMSLNPRSVDTLREQLFLKLDVKSRVGLAMVAIKNGIVVN